MTPEQFVEALQSRGVTLSVKNNRLRFAPGSAWRTLSAEEAACLAEHRAGIKRLVDGSEPTLTERRTSEPASAPSEPTPEPVVWTADYTRRITPQDLHDAGVTGSNRASYMRAREWLREQRRKEQGVKATNTMLVSLLRHQRGSHGGYRGGYRE